MLNRSSRALGQWLLATGLVGTAIAGACAEPKGAIMLAINTDMRAPKDVNAVSVSISTNGAIKHSFIGRVTPQGEVLLPATLAITEPEDKSASIRIRVMAFQDRKPRVLRDIRTTVPTGGRTALLRIPLNFVNDASAVGEPLPPGVVPDAVPGTGGMPTGGGSGGGAADFDFFGSFQPPCDDIQNQTIIDGECKDNFVDPATLPDFDTAQLGDSTDVGSCFDVARCFNAATSVGSGGDVAVDAGSDASRVPPGPPDASDGQGDAGSKFKDYRPAAVTLDTGTCSLQMNGASPERLNIALVTRDAGECVRPGECYVPIDRGGAGGWKAENGRVQLPTFVCRLIGAKQLRLATSTETCAAKEESNPICTPVKPADTDLGPTQCVDSKLPPPPSTVAMVLQLTQVNLGELDDVTRQPVKDAWKRIGFDLDRLCTTKLSTDVCQRQGGADSAKQEDGERGIDNAWGRTVLGFLQGLVPTPSKTTSESGTSYIELDGRGGAVFYMAVQGAQLSFPMLQARIVESSPGSAEFVTGTLAGIVPTEAMVDSFGTLAGRLSTQLCGGSTLDTIKQTIRQAGDIREDGSNVAGVPCNAISFGITFTGRRVAQRANPDPTPDPCTNPNPQPDGG